MNASALVSHLIDSGIFLSSDIMNSTKATTDPTNVCGWPALSFRSGSVPSIRYLDLISYPFLLLLTTVGNALILSTLCVKSDRGRSRSKSTFIIAIAIADLTYMWFSLFSYIHSYDGEIHGRPAASLTWFYDAVGGVVMFVQEVLAFTSAWLIVAFSAERFLAIRWPMLHMRFSRGKRSLQISLLIVCLSAVAAMVRLVDYYRFYNLYLKLNREDRPAIRPPRPTWLLRWYSSYLWIQALMQIGTFLVILILNLWLLYTILEQRRFRKDFLHPMSSHRSGQPTKTNSDWTTLPMLGVCVVLYLITQIPEFMVNAIFLLEQGCIVQAGPELRAVLAPLANFLLNVNFSLNFALYCGVDGQFRKMIASILTSCRKTTAVRTSRLRSLLAVHSSQGTKSTTSGSTRSLYNS